MYTPLVPNLFTSDLIGSLGAFQKFAIPKVRTILLYIQLVHLAVLYKQSSKLNTCGFGVNHCVKNLAYEYFYKQYEYRYEGL